MTGGPSVIVIGGGVTGTGIARDLAMRGADVTLFERDRLAEGTTGRMHGLLHSGARYAVSDPESARQCIQENGILRDIASHCVEETGGLFVSLAADDPEYFETKKAACAETGIPAQEIDPGTARQIEPALADEVERALLVPDAAIDPFRLVAANAASAEDHGADIRTGTPVLDIVLEDQDGSERAVGVLVDEGSDPPTTIYADHVVNAAGPWVAAVVESLEIDIPLAPAKGAMAVTNSRPVDTVVNRCRPKGDGDILVPHETTAILGTTDIPVDDPDSVAETREEIDLLVDEIAEMVPSIEDTRLIRTYWGVRPLFDQGPHDGSPNDTSRDFAILDHEDRDGIAGLSTVLGGKLTTYRLMAAQVSDHVSTVLDIDSACRTASEPLPGSRGEVEFEELMERFDLRSPIATRTRDRLGDRTPRVLETSDPNPVVCECEGVTRAEILEAIDTVGPDLGAVRMQTRATMGTCQGGFCSHRLAVLLAGAYGTQTAWSELESLLDERWKGQQFVLEGEHLSQVALNRSIRSRSLNLEGLPAAIPHIPIEEFDGGRKWALESREGAEDSGTRGRSS